MGQLSLMNIMDMELEHFYDLHNDLLMTATNDLYFDHYSNLYFGFLDLYLAMGSINYNLSACINDVLNVK